MLSFLLDKHISPVIAEQIILKEPNIQVYPLLTWQQGAYFGLLDEIILQAATDAQLTLVTYDQNTIPPLLCAWGESDQSHHGVIFIDYQTIPPSDFGGLVRSLVTLWQREHHNDWVNRLIYLKN